MIEAFRENGLNTLEYNAEIDEARLECIVASVFYALYKRLPSSNDIDVENNIVSLTQWIMHAYDRNNSGRIRVISIKTALTMLCNGRLVDKMRYIFTQISESSGILNVSRFEFYLRELLTLPAAVGEEPNFSYEEGGYQEFFKPSGMMDPNSANLEQFLQSMIAERASGTLFWVHMLHKLMRAYADTSVWNVIIITYVRTVSGGKKNLALTPVITTSENIQHGASGSPWMRRMKYARKSIENKGEKGNSVRRRFLCSPTRTSNKLPDYPKEPEPNKTLDMSNIM
eukprot:gene6901-12512_t